MSKMDQTNDKTEDLSDKVASEDVGAGNHSLPRESNSNHCAINLLTDTNDSASSEGLDSVGNNHCAIALKSDSNNCDTNLLGSNTCDMTSEPCDSPQSVGPEITADVQHDDSALVLSPVSEGSMMDISGGLEILPGALYLTSTGVDSLQITRKDDSGICVDKEDIVHLKLQSTDSSLDDRKSSQQCGETEVMCLTQGHNTERREGIVSRDKLAANLQEDEDMFMDSDEHISYNTDIVEDLSRNSGTNQDVQSKDTDKDSLSVLDSPECSDKCHKEKAREKGLVLVPGFSSDEDGDQLEEEAACQIKNKKVKPLVDYDDSDDNTSGPTSYDVANGKRSSDKSASSSSSESEDEMDALDVFLARRKRQMDSDRSNQGSRHGNNDDEDEDTNENRNTAESRTRVESEEEGEGVITYSQPKDPWSPLLEVRARELGFNNTTYGPEKFRMGCGASVKFVQRLQRQSKLESHEGCVNALHFNKSGTSLASGSDDLNIVVWDWIHEKPFFTFDSGHRSNVFQCKFMPYTGDCHMVSCARDGQVRLAELSTTGKCKNTKKLALHKGAAHKLALLEDSSHVFYSCGEDAVVYEIDLRQDKPNKLCTTREKEKKIPLYSIHSNPFKSYEYCVGGRDHFLRVYDKRKISGDGSGDSEVKKFCPHHLIDSDIKANVTCAVYNWNGMEVLGTYNDEDIYLFDNTHSDGANHIARFKGHRNNATVKGVNFYGPKSEFVVSGSDCGNVFLWEKQSQTIVNFFKADEAGVVNVLEPHPHMPVLATSGLDHDVKVWSPHAPEATKLEGLSKLIKKNRKERTEERSSDPDMYDGHMLWFLMHHLRRARRMRGADGGGSSTDSDDVERGESENSEDDEPMQCVQS